MSLNEDAVADLEETLVDEDVVRSSPIQPVTDKTTTILVDMPNDRLEAQALTEADVQALTDTTIQFKFISDQVAKTVDLQEIEKEFIAQESIDRHTAQYLNEHFEGLLSSKIAIEEYTRTPSRTNLEVTRRFVKTSIAQEEMQIIDTFNSFTVKSLTDTEQVLLRLKEKYLYDFALNMRDLAHLAEQVIADVSQNKNTIVPYQNGEHIEFIDIADLDLVKLDFANLKLDVTSVSELSAYKSNITSILTQSSIRTLMAMVIDCGKVSYPVDREILLLAMDKPISLLILAKFFNHRALLDYIDSFDAIIAESLSLITQVREALPELKTFEAIRNYLIQQSASIHQAIHQPLQLACHVNNLNLLALNVKALFIYLSKLSHPKA